MALLQAGVFPASSGSLGATQKEEALLLCRAGQEGPCHVAWDAGGPSPLGSGYPLWLFLRPTATGHEPA